jgi:hypothetical protein
VHKPPCGRNSFSAPALACDFKPKSCFLSSKTRNSSLPNILTAARAADCGQALQEEHGAERPRPILAIFAGELRASAASNIVRLKRG